VYRHFQLRKRDFNGGSWINGTCFLARASERVSATGELAERAFTCRFITCAHNDPVIGREGSPHQTVHLARVLARVNARQANEGGSK